MKRKPSKKNQKNRIGYSILAGVTSVLLLWNIALAFGARHFEWGQRMIDRQGWFAAHHHLKHSLRMNAFQSEAHYLLSRVSRQIFNRNRNRLFLEEALSHSRRSVSLAPYHPEYLVQQGTLQIEMARFDEGLESLRKAIDLAIFSPDYYEKYIEGLRAVGMYHVRNNEIETGLSYLREGTEVLSLMEENFERSLQPVRDRGQVQAMTEELHALMEDIAGIL